jgi:uncharacterized protein (TIGR02246 family)
MKRHWSFAVLASCCLALLVLSCEQRQQPASDTRAADEAAIRAINPAWFKSYNAGDVNSVVALYAEDAVVNAPGVPAARGQAAIREYFQKDIAASAAAGVTTNSGPSTDVGVSGDLGWEWGTFTVTNKSGATIDAGKYVTVCAKRDGKWLVVRDIWNSDGPMKAMQ